MEKPDVKIIQLKMKKSEIKTLIDDFREFIVLYRFSFGKESTKLLIIYLRNYEKIVNGEKEDNIEYLKDQFNSLKNFKKAYLKKKYRNYKVKYFGTDETIRYLFEDDYEDYNSYKFNQQYQSFSGKILLPLNKYLEKIRSELTKLIKNYKVKINISFVFQSKKSLMMNVMCLLKVTIQWNCIQLVLIKYLVN